MVSSLYRKANLTVMERHQSCYEDSQDLVKYVDLDEYVPEKTKKNIAKLLPDFSYDMVRLTTLASKIAKK